MLKNECAVTWLDVTRHPTTITARITEAHDTYGCPVTRRHSRNVCRHYCTVTSLTLTTSVIDSLPRRWRQYSRLVFVNTPLDTKMRYSLPFRQQDPFVFSVFSADHRTKFHIIRFIVSENTTADRRATETVIVYTFILRTSYRNATRSYVFTVQF